MIASRTFIARIAIGAVSLVTLVWIYTQLSGLGPFTQALGFNILIVVLVGVLWFVRKKRTKPRE